MDVSANAVPSIRLRVHRDLPLNSDGDYVLYWMISNRRLTWNYALQRAVEIANRLGKGVLILEAVRAGYRWASDRHHRFILDGMHDNALGCEHPGVRMVSYVETSHGDASGLLEGLAERACAVVTDAFPAFFLKRMVPTVARRMNVRVEAVDSNGIVPLAAPDRDFTRAFSYRTYIHKNMREFMGSFPEAEPLLALQSDETPVLPEGVAERWDFQTAETLAPCYALQERLSIDHTIKPSSLRGGANAAQERWRSFYANDLPRYADGRNHPDDDRSSHLSPYLHFGHISSHQLVAKILKDADWTLDGTDASRTGKNTGWWQLPEGAEAFLDQIITWRELAFVQAFREVHFEALTSIPRWAAETIKEHASDTREVIYDLETLAQSKTYDDIWNAAQTQLREEGRMHNYLRMLWGKKVLQWTPNAETAFEYLVELNNRYALDGRDPNSYAGILWIFGKFDRAWGPEREVFGKLRYMTSDSTRKKLRLRGYLAKYGAGQASLL